MIVTINAVDAKSFAHHVRTHAPAWVTPELVVMAKRPSIPVPRGARLVSFEAMIKRVSETQGAKAAAAWTQAIMKHQATINESALRAAVASGSVSRIAKVINAAKLASATAAAVTGPLRGAVQTAGEQSAVTLSGHGISATFNHVDSKVVAYARKQAAELVRGVPKDTKRIIGEVIAMGAEGALTTAEQARAIREVVGLPPNWARSPLRFADELRRGAVAAATSRRLSAIDKQLIRSRIRAGTVDKAFIATMQSRYTESLINRRAQNIARTESLRASHYGLQQSWVQMEKAGALPKTARRFWIITPDSHLSPEHARIPAMNPNGRKMDEPFSTTEGMHMFPPSRPNCRCSVGLVFFPPKSAKAGTPLRAVPKAPPKPRLLRRGGPTLTPEVPNAAEVHRAVTQVLGNMGVSPKVVRYSSQLGAPGEDVLGEYKNGKLFINPRRPIAEIRQTVAHEATHLKFEQALRKDPAIRDEIYADYAALKREDGVTAYSRAHWNAKQKLEGLGPMVRDWTKLLPVNETLAELQALKVAGRAAGTPRYQALLKRVEKAAAMDKRTSARAVRRRVNDLLRPKRKMVEAQGDAAWTQAKATSPAEWAPAQRDSLKAYSGGSSGTINEFMRGVDGRSFNSLSDKYQRHVLNIDEAFAQASPLTEPLLVHRGGLLPRSMVQEGAEFQDLGFVSTSTNPKTAAEFIRPGAGDLAGYHIRVHVPEGARAVGMDARVSISSREQEVLLPRGSRFRVRGTSTVKIPAKYQDAPGFGRSLLTPAEERTIVDVDYILPEAPRVPAPKAKRVKKPRTLRRAESEDMFEGYAEGKKAAAAANRSKLNATIDERSALKAYQLTPDVNNSLRREQVLSLRSTDRKLVASLDSALQKNRVSQDLVVWRGTSPEWLPPEGVVFADAGFVSTTARPSVAAEFVGGTSRDIGALMRIGVPKGQPAVYMPQLGRSSYSAGEQELLLPRGTRFRVVRSRTVSGAEANRLLGASSFYDEQRLIINDVEIVK